MKTDIFDQSVEPIRSPYNFNRCFENTNIIQYSVCIEYIIIIFSANLKLEHINIIYCLPAGESWQFVDGGGDNQRSEASGQMRHPSRSVFSRVHDLFNSYRWQSSVLVTLAVSMFCSGHGLHILFTFIYSHLFFCHVLYFISSHSWSRLRLLMWSLNM